MEKYAANNEAIFDGAMCAICQEVQRIRLLFLILNPLWQRMGERLFAF